MGKKSREQMTGLNLEERGQTADERAEKQAALERKRKEEEEEAYLKLLESGAEPIIVTGPTGLEHKPKNGWFKPGVWNPKRIRVLYTPVDPAPKEQILRKKEKVRRK